MLDEILDMFERDRRSPGGRSGGIRGAIGRLIGGDREPYRDDDRSGRDRAASNRGYRFDDDRDDERDRRRYRSDDDWDDDDDDRPRRSRKREREWFDFDD